jgi:hypothetical protein
VRASEGAGVVAVASRVARPAPLAPGLEAGALG